MTAPKKKASKPRAKLGRAAGDTRSADRISLADGVARRSEKDDVAGLGDFETQHRLFESDFDRVVAETKRLGESAAKGTSRKGKEP